MNEKQSNINCNQDEINIKDLFLILWKRKAMIICLSLVVALLAAMYSKFIISPVYDAKLNIIINMPEKYITRYGDYYLPITTNDQYINLITSNDVLLNTMKDMGYDSSDVTLDNLKNRIIIVKGDTRTNSVQNSFEVSVSADNPEKSLELAQKLYNNYIEFMDVMTKYGAINYFINHFKMEIKSFEYSLDREKEILKKNELLLLDTPQLIAKGHANIEIRTNLSNNSDYVIPIESVNPNYIKVESDIILNKQTINEIENSIRINNKYLEELANEAQAINEYYETGRVGKLEASVMGVVETSVHLPSPPVMPTVKTSPNNVLNTFTGGVIGGVIGVMASLIKEFWLK